MRKSFVFALGIVGFVAFAPATRAADVMPVTIVAPVVVPVRANTSAFVEVLGGFDLFNRNFEDDGDCSGCHGVGAGFGGNAQATWMMSPALSMQLGVWGEHWSGRSANEVIDVDWAVNRFGIGTHLSYWINDLLVGGFASIGQRDEFGFGTFATVGLEAALNASRFRVYTQAGITFGVAPDFVRDQQIRNFYGRVVGTFYATPNLALSVNAGAALSRIGGDAAGTLLTWGGRAEFQLPRTPLYFLASYQGGLGRFPPDPSVVNVMEHTFRIGIGLNIGSPDIQTRDRNVGLADFNCLYGVAGTPTVECGFIEGGSSG